MKIKKDIIKKKNKITFQTGYGPSGLPHIGTFGEVARTSMMINALNHIQKIDINNMNNQSLNEERTNFEMRWNYFNKIRTFIAFAASLSFLLILMVR